MRVFSEGFRIFFLSAGVFGILLGLVWTSWLTIQLPDLNKSTPHPFQWHAHEFIFGYGMAAVGGFFLTAVPNWTSTAAARTGFVAFVFCLWAIGRVAVWNAGWLPPTIVAVADLAFGPVLAVKILSQLLKRPKPQNMVFLTMLTAIWVANLMLHLEWSGAAVDAAGVGLQAGLLGLAGMIAILGGRVTPAFTRNAMKRAGVGEADWPHTPPVLNRFSMLLSMSLPWLCLFAPVLVISAVLILAGLVQIARLAGWKSTWVRDKPILWSLHLGMLLLGLGLLAWGLAGLGVGTESGAVHLTGIGAVGVMTVAVMSRAALGHTGRLLIAPRPAVWAYGLVATAALTRALGHGHPVSLTLAGLLWSAAMICFVVAIWPMVTQPRVDRKEAS